MPVNINSVIETSWEETKTLGNTRTIYSVFDRGPSIQSTSDKFIGEVKGLTWTVETHSHWHLAIVIRSEHNEATQTTI